MRPLRSGPTADGRWTRRQKPRSAADIYPRLAPTSEWDTAAAQAILAAAGGEIVDLDFTPLRYNQKDSLLNPEFIALGDRAYAWQALLR